MKINIDEAKSLFDTKGKVDGIGIQTKDVYRMQNLIQKIKQALGPEYTISKFSCCFVF